MFRGGYSDPPLGREGGRAGLRSRKRGRQFGRGVWGGAWAICIRSSGLSQHVRRWCYMCARSATQQTLLLWRVVCWKQTEKLEQVDRSCQQWLSTPSSLLSMQVRSKKTSELNAFLDLRMSRGAHFRQRSCVPVVTEGFMRQTAAGHDRCMYRQTARQTGWSAACVQLHVSVHFCTATHISLATSLHHVTNSWTELIHMNEAVTNARAPGELVNRN